jgi:hypothetical protein
MKRVLRKLLLVGVAAAGLALLPDSAEARHPRTRGYWDDYWSWYDQRYVPYWHHRNWRDPNWRHTYRHHRSWDGVRVGPVWIRWY